MKSQSTSANNTIWLDDFMYIDNCISEGITADTVHTRLVVPLYRALLYPDMRAVVKKQTEPFIIEDDESTRFVDMAFMLVVNSVNHPVLQYSRAIVDLKENVQFGTGLDFNSFGTVVMSMIHGWEGSKEEFFRVIIPMLSVLRPRTTKFSLVKNEDLFNILWLMKNKMFTTTQFQNDQDITKDTLSWIPRFASISKSLSKMLADDNLSSDEWVKKASDILSVMSTFCMMTILYRKLSLTEDKDCKVIISLIDNYVKSSRC